MRRYTTTTFAFLAVSAPATGLAAGPPLSVDAGDTGLQWQQAPAALPKGMMISILSGDPDKAGPFTLRLKMPPNTTIAPHTHTKDENVTVLAGNIVHETGRSLVRANGMALGTGGFVYLPANMPHSLWTTASAAEIQVTGSGPFGVTYVNAADDPRTKP